MDWIWAPIAALVVGAFTYDGPMWLAWMAVGAFGFQFVEWFAHRFVLHGLVWHSNHERHHLFPAERVVFPWYYVPSIFAAFFVVLPYPIFAGMILGYSHFLWIHHAFHHWDLSTKPLLARLAQWHDIHHQGIAANYTISSPLPDLIFGTYVSVEQARAMVDAR